MTTRASDRCSILALCALSCLIPGAVWAGPPANDDCSAAIAIGAGVLTGITIGASSDGMSTCGTADGSPDVWYSYTAPSDLFLSVSTCDGATDYDTVVSIHDDCPGVMANEIVCNDDDVTCDETDRASTATAILAAGETVLIRVTGFDGEAGNFTLAVEEGAILANDSCEEAIPIGPGTYVGTTSSATGDGAASCGLSVGSPDVWYSYTPSENGILGLTTCLGLSDYDTTISVHSACPGDLTTEVACNDDNENCPVDPLLSTLVTPVMAGRTLFIRMTGFQGNRGNFAFSLRGPESGGFSLTTTGTCPGTVTIEAAGATPNGVIGIFTAESLGGTMIPAGTCEGTELGLGVGPLALGTQATNDEGELAVDVTAPGFACANVIQVLDMTNCDVTNVTSVQ